MLFIFSKSEYLQAHYFPKVKEFIIHVAIAAINYIHIVILVICCVCAWVPRASHNRSAEIGNLCEGCDWRHTCMYIYIYKHYNYGLPMPSVLLGAPNWEEDAGGALEGSTPTCSRSAYCTHSTEHNHYFHLCVRSVWKGQGHVAIELETLLLQQHRARSWLRCRSRSDEIYTPRFFIWINIC